MLAVTAIAGQILCAAVLVHGAAGKLPRPSEFAHTLEGLGAGVVLARVGALAVLVSEATVATGLLVMPSMSLWRAATVALATGFAAAGAWAAARGLEVSCHCFGRTGHRLGRRQIVALPCWSAAVALADLAPPAWPPATGVLLLTALVVVHTAARRPGLLVSA
jgi:hypothetical protein